MIKRHRVWSVFGLAWLVAAPTAFGAAPAQPALVVAPPSETVGGLEPPEPARAAPHDPPGGSAQDAVQTAPVRTKGSAAGAADTGQIERRRFVLVLASNDGGYGRAQLRYAITDARTLIDVLEKTGGVRDSDVVFVAEPGPKDIDRAFADMNTRVARAQAAGAQVEVLFYYSGHSDERGLLSRGDRYDYRLLRQHIEAMPADVRVSILDSCASGALIRQKGGKRRAPFMMDRANLVRGVAYLTSSSANEVSQESDRIGGSFFTHHLLTGLRGAADVDGDRRVTLTEAYQYAFRETLLGTESTRAGPQHANYDIEMAGRGDVVLTDLDAADALLSLDKHVSGTLRIRDATGRLVVEMDKPAGLTTTLAMVPGAYEVVRRDGPRAYRAKLDVPAEQATLLAMADFDAIDDLHDARTRGPLGPNGAPLKLSYHPLALSLMQGFATSGTGQDVVVRGFGLGIFQASYYGLEGFGLGIGGNTTLGYGIGGLLAGGVNWSEGPFLGAQIAGVANVAPKRVAGLQLAGGANVSMGETGWTQIAGVTNVAGDFSGLQLAGGGNTTLTAVRGAQIGGVFNVNLGTVAGLQLAGVANVTNTLHGVQIGLANISFVTRGLSLGLVNVTDDAGGLQLGLVNVTRRMRGESLGLINVVLDGHHDVELGTTALMPTRLVVRSGGNHLVTVLGVGFDPVGFVGAPNAVWTGAGLGLVLPLRGFGLADTRIDLESSAWAGFGFTGAVPWVWRNEVAVAHTLGAGFFVRAGLGASVVPVLLAKNVPSDWVGAASNPLAAIIPAGSLGVGFAF